MCVGRDGSVRERERERERERGRDVLCIIRCVELNRGKIDTAKNSECPDSKLLTSPAKIISQNIFGHFSNIVSSTSSSIFECSIVFTKWQIWIRNKKRDIDHKFFSLTKSNFDFSLISSQFCGQNWATLLTDLVEP